MTSRVAVLDSDLYSSVYFQNNDICRLCWSRGAHKAITVKSSENGKSTKNLLAEKIEDCLNLDLSKEGAPKKVCKKCCDIVESFYDFKRFCYEADRKLNEILNHHVSTTTDNLPEHSFDVELYEKDNYSDIVSSDGHREDCLQEYLNLTLPKVEKRKIRRDESLANCSSKIKYNFSSTDSSNSNIEDSFQEYLNFTPVGGDQKQIIRKDVKEESCSAGQIYSCIEASTSNIEVSLQEYHTLTPLRKDQIKKIIKETEEENYSLDRQSPDTETPESNIQDSLQEYLNLAPLRGDQIKKTRKHTKKGNCASKRKYSDKETSGSNIETSSQEYLTKTSVRIEKIRKYPNHSQTFCYICRNDFKTIDKFTTHNSEYHGIETNGEYKCFGCNKRFKNRKNRLGHEINFCKGLKDGYKCGICGRYLPKRRTYEMHMKAHRLNQPLNSPGELFKCGKCYKLFMTRENLTEHKKSHEIKEDFVCEACGRCFSRRDYLNKHRLTHQGLRLHACPHCDYKAVQKTSLLVHLRKHTGERPFSCDLCPQRCVTSSNLRAHRQRHLGVKQFQCTICSKKFGYKQSLEEHIASTHERAVQSHTCPHCGAIYSGGRGLRRHVEAKHGKSKEKSLPKTDSASGEELISSDKYEVRSSQELVSKDQKRDFVV